MTDSYKHILAPIDGSSVAAQALDHAAAIALRSGAQLTLLQIVPDVATVATEPVTPLVGTGNFEKFDPPVDLPAMQSGWIARTCDASGECRHAQRPWGRGLRPPFCKAYPLIRFWRMRTLRRST